MRQLAYIMFISNNRAPFHLWWKEKFLEHWKVPKYYETDCKFIIISSNLAEKKIGLKFIQIQVCHEVELGQLPLGQITNCKITFFDKVIYHYFSLLYGIVVKSTLLFCRNAVSFYYCEIFSVSLLVFKSIIKIKFKKFM